MRPSGGGSTRQGGGVSAALGVSLRSVAALMAGLAVMSPTVVRAGGFDRAIESALPRVVKLYGLGAGLEKGYGSAVLISEDGMAVTVFSLLIDARRIRAVTADGTTYAAEVLFRDYARQLALLRLASVVDGSQTVGPFSSFDLACDAPDDEADLRPGDWVVAAGNAFKVADGAEPVSFVHGIFSARTRLDARRRVKDFPYTGDVLVIDAITSNPGSPGGALVDLDGRLVGLIGREVTSNLTHTHFNYAIPRDVLCDFMRDATAGSPPDPLHFAGLNLPGRSAEAAAADLFDTGVRISKAGYRTVLPFVARVQRGSPADGAGVQNDDLVLAVNGRNIKSADEYEERIKDRAPEEPVTLVIRRGRRILTVELARPVEPTAAPKSGPDGDGSYP